MPIKYQTCLNQGNEALKLGKSITVNEIVETVDEKALAREIHHLNQLIPQQVAEAVLANFCQAAAQLMAMGYAVTLKNGNDVALRIYPDVHLRCNSINLARAKELDPSVSALSMENAGDLATKAGVTVRAKAECEAKFTELLLAQGASVERKAVVEKAFVARKGSQGGSAGGGSKPGDNAEEVG